MTVRTHEQTSFQGRQRSRRNQIDDVFNRPGLPAVDFTAAAKGNSSQLEVDATSATLFESELTAVAPPLLVWRPLRVLSVLTWVDILLGPLGCSAKCAFVHRVWRTGAVIALKNRPRKAHGSLSSADTQASSGSSIQ